MTQFHIVTNSVAPSQVRETGSAYIIEDVPFVKPMELAGGYVPEESIQETIDLWDGVPATLRHPRNARGEPVAANRQPETHLGIGEDPYYDGDVARFGKLVIDKDRLEAVDGADAVREALENEEPIDVSSQYAAEDIPPGEYDGAMRKNVERITRPDSVAILPDQRGRCSIEHGCGIDPQLVANAEVSVPLTDDPVSPATGLGEGNGPHQTMQTANILQEARTPEFDSTETSEEQRWGDVSKDLSDVTDALGIDADSVAEMTDDQRQEIASLTLLGDPDADTWRELFFFPVVNPSTGDLNEGGLNAVRGGRGESADIPDSTYASAEAEAERLLADNFDDYDDLVANALTGLLNGVVARLGAVTAANEPAESGVDGAGGDPGGGSQTMDHDQLINDITANSPLTEDALEERDEDALEAIHEDVMAANDDPDDPDEEDTVTDEDYVTHDELEEALDGLADDVADRVTANQEDSTKDELAREIVANSADYDEPEDVREDFPTVAALETKRDQVTDSGGLPGAGADFEANLGDDDDIDVSSGVLTE